MGGVESGLIRTDLIIFLHKVSGNFQILCATGNGIVVKLKPEEV